MTSYGPAAELLLGIVAVPGALATTTRYARRLDWPPRIAFGLVVGLAVLGLCVLAVVVSLAPGVVFWPVMVAVVVLVAVLGHWRGRTRKAISVVEVDATPAPRLHGAPRMAAPAPIRREDPQP